MVILQSFKEIEKEFKTLTKKSKKSSFYFQNIVYVKSIRELKNLFFIDVNDGTVIYSVQAVIKKNNFSEDDLKLIKALNIYSVLLIKGPINFNFNNQKFEIIIDSFKIYKNAKVNPIQKKELTLDYLRTIPEYRIFTKTFFAIFKIRSWLFQLINQFLTSCDYLYLNSPIITNNDSEGSGEVFEVKSKVDNNFFQDKGFLTVSGQLHIEPFAMAFDKVYIFSPCFRSEKSNTTKHLSEFWMLELESKNQEAKDMIDLFEKMINYLAKHLLKHCSNEIKYLNDKVDNNLLEKIEKWQSIKIKSISYNEAVPKLNEFAQKLKRKDLTIEWGEDLSSIHEKFITSSWFKDEFVAVLGFPKKIKPFYMKKNKENDLIYNCYDVLAPSIGEIVGGSEREDDFETLVDNFNKTQVGNQNSNIEWYLNLRHHAYYKLVGFGLGFDRLVMLFTSQTNIKDVIPYPRFYNSFLK